MEGENADWEAWEYDEIETLKSLVQIYRQNFERVSRADRAQYTTHEELLYAFKKLIDYFDRSLTQIERMSDCIQTLTDSMGKLADEVLYLRGRLDGETELE